MTEFQKTGFAERLKTAAEAKLALLAKFKSKPAVTDPLFEQRDAIRSAELEDVRQQRADAKAAAKQAVLDAQEAVRQDAAALETAALQAKRGERKERKALTKVEAKAKRDARYAARQARR
jgi:hypothetical protein